MSKVVECAHAAGRHLNSRRIVVFNDGTWNNSNASNSPATNVSRLSGAVTQKCCCGRPQIVYYHPGVGTEASWVGKKLGGLLGLGVAQDIAETYRFICDNYEPGDELVLVGFSRGAFTARSVADMICHVGFLNRAGLDRLPDIFRDYETWQDWKKEDNFDETKFLAGFTLENYDRVRRMKLVWGQQERVNVAGGDGDVEGKAEALSFVDAWEARMKEKIPMSDKEKKEYTPDKFAQELAKTTLDDLNKRKKDLWDGIRKAETVTEISALYRKELEEHRLVLVEKVEAGDSNGQDEQYKYRPIEGKIRAIGVWDTVGSLGVPNGPWGAKDRSDHEIRFTSLQMHENVEFAFHALALDEYRTAFSPTLWELGSNEKTTLRQVWFPGNHGDVGGGWEDEQPANIALAWMADQLTSIGVEFTRSEMQRIFYDVNSQVIPRNWAMGQIHNPPTSTAILDKVWSSVQFKEPTPRSPGLYKRDKAKPKTSPLNPSSWFAKKPPREDLDQTHEFIHPCVRIRYSAGGKGPDDEPTYRCRALTENGYELIETTPKQPLPDPRPLPERSGHSYAVVGGGNITSIWDPNAVVASASAGAPRVHVQQPIEGVDVLEIPAARNAYVWRRPAQGDKPEIVLLEEQVGVWERLYMKVQEELVDWKPMYVARAQAAKKKADDEAGPKNYEDMIVWQKGLAQ